MADMRDVHTAMFSGGRSSGMMVCDAITGELPLDEVLFCNTGMESDETYLFVREAAKLMGGRLTCLEFTHDGKYGSSPAYRVVGVDDLNTEGRPMEELVRWRRYLPNRRTRFCTTELKVRTALRYLYDAYGMDCLFHKYIGIRADEGARAARIRSRNDAVEARVAEGKRPYKWTDLAIMPLFERGVRREHVIQWWKGVSLDLPFDYTDERVRISNCVGCFNNDGRYLVRHAQQYPAIAKRWERMEIMVNAGKDAKAKAFPKDRFARKWLGRDATDAENRCWTSMEKLTWGMLREAAAKAVLPPDEQGQAEMQFAGCSDGECSLDV